MSMLDIHPAVRFRGPKSTVGVLFDYENGVR
jgi:hypothetical protein